MRLSRLVTILCVTMLCTVLGEVTQEGYAQSNVPLQVSLSLESKEFPLHGLLKASVRIDNNSDETYNVDLGIDREQAFTLIVKTPAGKEARWTKHVTEGLHSPGIVRIEPKSAYTQTLTLNQWWEFDALGTYHVTLLIDAPVVGDISGRLKVSMQADVNVSAPDARYLQNQCEQLLETVSSSSAYQDAIDAAKNLSAIDDPIAAPYLAQAAAAKPAIAYISISGLEKLGTKEAVDGLLNLAKNQNGDLKLLATRSLKQLELSAQDPVIKEQITSGLATISHP